MSFDLNKTIKLDTETDDLNNIYKELLRSERLLKQRAKELTVIRIIDYLKKHSGQLIVNIGMKDCSNNPYFEVNASFDKDDDMDMIIAEDINDLITLPDLFIRDVISYTSKNAEHSEIDFKNTPKGRDKLIKFIIGEDWKVWKKENETLISYDNLNKDLPINQVTKIKRKL